MSLYAIAQRHKDGRYSDLSERYPHELANTLAWLRSEWGVADPKTRGGFPVVLVQLDGDWYECEETPPYAVDKKEKAVFVTAQIEVVDDCDCAYQESGTPQEAECRTKEGIDPYRPASPNILTFGIANRSTKYDNLLHYWVLRDSSGGRIGSSADYFESKEEAMLNAIAIFGKELWAGYHVVAKQSDGELVMQLGVDIETGERAL